MINIINEAINRKIASISFTNIITGKVVSVKPLQIRINDRIVIGQSFIEPMSLGLNDYSPSSALPLVVGEVVQMIRYNNGQRFYVLGKTVSASAVVVDYDKQVENKPKLITTVVEPLMPGEESIIGEVALHKIAKTGSYEDLNGLPTIPEIPDNYVTTNTDQTVDGVKTFSKLPISPNTPVADEQLANKLYVDDNFLQFDVIREFSEVIEIE